MDNNPTGFTLPVEAGDTAIVLNDIHFRSHNKRAMDIIVQFAQDIRPDHTILNGDIHDYNALSKHEKDSKSQVENGALVHEAEASRPYMDALYESTRKRRVYGPGNHEDRWIRFVNDNPGLYGLDWHTPLGASVSRWELLQQDYEIYAGGLTIAHGHNLTGSLTKYPAHSVASNHPRENILFGHCHRIDRHSETLWSNGVPHEHTVWTNGHLQDLSQVSYQKRTKWRYGFSLIRWWESRKKLHFTVDQMELFMDGPRMIMEGGGKVYRA